LSSSAPALLRGLDRAAFVVAFAERLRRAGVNVDFSGIVTLTDALDVDPPSSRTRLYWACRVCLVRRVTDIETFDAVFQAVFADAVFSLDPHARRSGETSSSEGPDDAYVPLPSREGSDEQGEGLPWVTLPSVVDSEGESDESDFAIPERLPSDIEAIADLPFDELNEADLGLLESWLTDALRRWPTRKSRRQAAHHAGSRVALRPTLARARRTGFYPVELVYQRPVRRPRRVVMLCDVSQSMQIYAAPYLHMMRAAALATDSEVYAFATTLTRLTNVLAHKSAEVAMARATDVVVDRFGGTKIAASVNEMLRSRHGNAARGAIVLIASDGWDTDEPEAMQKAMARLRRRAHKVIWLNPRAAAPGYEPLVGAMAAALPYCDDFLPAHSIRAMADVVAAIVSASGR
jgi:hypothetical protein